MTLIFDISTDLNRVSEKLLKSHKREIPFAASRAINDTVIKAQKLLKIKAKREIDRPTPFTMRGFGVKLSHKSRLSGSIFIREKQWAYLKHIIKGGPRYPRGKMIAVPMKDVVRLNKYGNVSGKRKGILKKDMFAATINGKTGVWKRVGGKKKKLKLAYSFKSAVRYKRTFNYYRHIKRVIEVNFSDALDKRLKWAISSGYS